MSGDDFSGDAAQYAELAGEMYTQSSDPLDSLMGGAPPEPEALDQREVDARIAHQNAQHARAAQQAPQYQEQHQQPRLPSVEEDPIGHFEHRAANAEQALQVVATMQAGRQFWDQVQDSEARAKEEISNYTDAIEHLETNRFNELCRMFPDERLRQMGHRDPQATRIAMLNQDRIHVAQAAMDQGLSPAHVYYELAKARGFEGQRHISPRESKNLAAAYDRAAAGDEKAGEFFDYWWDAAARRGLL